MTSMTNYRILTYPICLSPSIPLPSSWKLFADEMATGHGESNGGESRLGREGDPILRSKKEPLFDVDFMAGAQVIHGASHSLMDGAFRHVIAAGGSVLAVSDDWRQGQILVMGETYGLQTVLDHLFYTHVVQRQVLQIHSSLIRVRNRGKNDPGGTVAYILRSRNSKWGYGLCTENRAWISWMGITMAWFLPLLYECQRSIVRVGGAKAG